MNATGMMMASGPVMCRACMRRNMMAAFRGSVTPGSLPDVFYDAPGTPLRASARGLTAG